ncbi:11930_t:CDS:10 [Ambispora gerdemannii]|uniref:11930_t:CDS:1 n=1 Tax=Ambispora gerdemannii TaxID=144530 RepID=A0A9N9F705_9GLOM|nr:11930_t:CDS:10 [Ambispora gerdemannii]
MEETFFMSYPTCQLSWLNLVHAEIISVTSAMRKNSRWSGMSVSRLNMGGLGMSMGLRGRTAVAEDTFRSQESPLMTGFSNLRIQLSNISDVREIDALALLEPFLEVIRSGDTNGPITATALSSVEKFLAYKIININSPNLSVAMSNLSSAATHCKFEASDPVSDEFVLLKILQVLRLALTSEVGQVLSDEALCEMMETGLSMCCQMRLSELLRRSAEHTMIVMVQTMFERVQDDGNSEDSDLKLFGILSIKELLRVLISLLDPHDHKHTDTMRLMALSILNVAFEVGGHKIGRFQPLRELVIDDLCKFLFQLARTENILLLLFTLRVISTVFDTMRPYLKLQGELYLSFLIERLISPTNNMRNLEISSEFSSSFVSLDSPLSSGMSTPLSEKTVRPNGESSIATGEVRELLLESLGQFSRTPTFMVDLWVNYDCNLYCGDLFEDVVKFLSRNSLPDSTGYSASNSHILCLDALLLYINYTVDRIQTGKNGNNSLISKKSWDQMSATDYNDGIRPSEYLSPIELLDRKKQKQILIEGASKFNENPKAGLEFLEANGIINDSTTDKNTSIASFLKATPRINKKHLGDFISKPSNIDILKAFVELFDFSGKRMDEALREMLETFRLPGEAQQISRIMEVFAETYFASGPSEIASRDAAFILSYSVIMLNTDLHNPQVRRRMTLEDYMKNLRNENNGENFPPEYLQAIYEAIRKKEIVMPEEHEGQLGFNYAWKELLRRAESAGALIVCDISLYDKDMFMVAWKPIVAAIIYAFNSAPDDNILQKAITGFHQCALISAHYHLLDVFDYIIMSLAKLTGLLEVRYANANGNANIPVKVQDTELTVSDLSIQFGRNYKGQLAAVVLFAVANEHGNVLREGWKYILEIFKNLFINSLLPSSMLQVEDFLAGKTTIPLKPKNASLTKQERNRDNSLLSTLSSYLLSPYSSNYEYLRNEPTEEEIEFTMCTTDCVVVCRLEDLFADIRLLEEDSLEHLMNAIKFIADGFLTSDPKNLQRSSTPVSITQPTSKTTTQTTGALIPYDPAAIFFLELMINVTLQNRDRIKPIIFEHISDILINSQNHSILLVERTVVALLRLCIRLTHKEEMVSDVLQSLELLKALPLEVINAVGEQMMAGILNLIKSDASYIRGKAPWETVFYLLGATSNHPQASRYSFETIACLVGEHKNISIHNFSESVELLTEFASAATFTGESEMHNDNNKNSRLRISKTQSAIIERARRAVELLYQLYVEIPKLLNDSEASPGEAWSTYWLPILTGLSQQCYNPCRDVRQYAITYLQRALLDPELVSHGVTEWVVIFDVVLFPLLDQLLKPEIFEADPVGMEETRMRASALLCKIFLHYLNKLAEWGGLTSLWSQILDIMERYMDNGENESLMEAIPESLKNMLLVMSTSGILNPPISLNETTTTLDESNKASNRAPIELWNITWTKIDKFLPKLKDELFPSTSSSNPLSSLPDNNLSQESTSENNVQSGFEIIDQHVQDDIANESSSSSAAPKPEKVEAAELEKTREPTTIEVVVNTNTSISDDVIIV